MISVGFVTFYPVSSKYKVLLLDHGSHISHPKGHQEKGETKLETAMRELKEETNLSVNFASDIYLSTHSYDIQRNGRTERKQVFLYGAITKAGPISISEEHQDYYLVGLDHAKSILTYQGDKDALVKAKEWLADIHDKS